jgi:hypothetical protein
MDRKTRKGNAMNKEVNYPIQMFHPEYGPRLITNVQMAAELGAGWVHSPNEFPSDAQEAKEALFDEQKYRSHPWKRFVPVRAMDVDFQPEPSGEDIELEAMNVSELRALADEKGIKVHPRSGKTKIIAAIREE